MYESYYRQVPWYAELWRGWLDMFRGDWPEVIIAIIIGLVALFIGLLVAFGIFYAMDKWFTPKEEGAGRVTKRWIREGYWTDESYTENEWGFGWSGGKYSYGYHTVTKYRKVWVEPQPMVEVTLIDDNVTHEFAVTQAQYDVAGMQRPVRITFQRGRFTGSVYIGSYVNA